MNKYIDSNKLEVEIERLKSQSDGYGIYFMDKIIAYIDELQQEQPQVADASKMEQSEVDLENAAQHVYESWMGGTMDDVRRDMVELGRVINAERRNNMKQETKSFINVCDGCGEHFHDGNDFCSYIDDEKGELIEQPSEQKYEGKELHDIVIAELGKYNGNNFFKAPWAIDSTGLQYPLYFANLGAKWQKEQKPAEWSQDDNNFADDAIACVTRCYEKYKDNKEFYQSLHHNTMDIKRWLIEVRKRLTPHWKPSKEQMKALGNCFCDIGEGCPDEEELRSLYNDLKKL